MGTLVRITVESRNPQRAEAAMAKAFARIHELDLRLSNYKPGSEVNHFDPARVSDDLRPVLDLSLRLARETQGAFDPTQTALFDLWRTARRARRLPTATEIASATSPGYRALKAGTRLDLGGIAKGYAADEAIKAMRSVGESHVLVAVSGDLVAGDAPAKQPGWRIGLEMAQRMVVLKRAGVSTSGDTEQYLEADGKRYSHIVDPRTGLGLTNGVIASVMAKTGMLADALATVVCLLGVAEGTRLAKRYGVVVYPR
jgi:thiamine biosynthesis lipoprotein